MARFHNKEVQEFMKDKQISHVVQVSSSGLYEIMFYGGTFIRFYGATTKDKCKCGECSFQTPGIVVSLHKPCGCIPGSGAVCEACQVFKGKEL